MVVVHVCFPYSLHMASSGAAANVSRNQITRMSPLPLHVLFLCFMARRVPVGGFLDGQDPQKRRPTFAACWPRSLLVLFGGTISGANVWVARSAMHWSSGNARTEADRRILLNLTDPGLAVL